MLVIRGRNKEASCLLHCDGSLYVRDSHKKKQADATGKSEDVLHWLVCRLSVGFGWRITLSLPFIECAAAV